MKVQVANVCAWCRDAHSYQCLSIACGTADLGVGNSLVGLAVKIQRRGRLQGLNVSLRSPMKLHTPLSRLLETFIQWWPLYKGLLTLCETRPILGCLNY